MSSVKRRLVYVADESEALLHSLTGNSPPTPRPSRLSHIHVTPSSDDKQHSLSTPPPLPAGATTVALGHGQEVMSHPVDPLLLVSYDGHLLADGTGAFHKPRNAMEADTLRAALHACRVYLREFAQSHPSPDPATPSTPTWSDPSDGDSYDSGSDPTADFTDVSGGSSDDEGSDRYTCRRRAAGRRKAAAVGSAGLAALTVAELREELRAAGLPRTGNKAVLIERLREAHGEPALVGDEPPTSVPSEMVTHRLRHSQECSARSSALHASLNSPHAASVASSVRTCGVEASTPDPQSPNSARSSIGGFWGTLVNVGSLFFRPSLPHAQRVVSTAGERKRSAADREESDPDAESHPPTKRGRLS